MPRYQRLGHILVACWSVAAVTLFVSTAHADERAQAAVLREFFEGYKGQIGNFAHPILAANGGAASVIANATTARIAIQYSSNDRTIIDIPVNEYALFSELRVMSDTALLPAFMSLDMMKGVADHLVHAEMAESEDGENDSRVMRWLQGQLAEQWDNLSGPDLYRYVLNIRWVQSGYLRRYRNAAYAAYVPPLDPGAGGPEPRYAPAPPAAEAPVPAEEPQGYAPPPAPDAPDPGVPPEQSDDAPAEPSSRHSAEYEHDGFYLRASMGVGLLSVSFDDKAEGGKTLDGHVQAPGGAIAFGGSPRPGFVVGGMVLGEGNNVKLRRGTDPSTHRAMGMVLVAPFIDYFPSPSHGFHLGVALGPSVIPIEEKDDNLRTTGGVGGALWLGYDFWVAKQWSFGPQLIGSGCATDDSSTDSELAATAGSIKLLLTALYH